MSYERKAMAQLSNDVKNQCQILSTQLRDGENLLKTEDEGAAGELTQLASLYDGRIIIIDQNFQIIEGYISAGRRTDHGGGRSGALF